MREDNIICEGCGSSVWRVSTARFCFPCADKRQRESIGRWHRKTPQARWANSKVATATLAGRLERPTDRDCVDCGGPVKVYDHRDYSRPLDVEPVCYRCNFMAEEPPQQRSIGPSGPHARPGRAALPCTDAKHAPTR